MYFSSEQRKIKFVMKVIVKLEFANFKILISYTCTYFFFFFYIVINIPFLFSFTENLAPSELKKLRNKQRKQRRKAELERQQAAQAQEKREQHNKSRQQTDPDLEQPTLDELIPEKLERVSINRYKLIVIEIIRNLIQTN